MKVIFLKLYNKLCTHFFICIQLLISGGRGLGSKEGFKILEELADVLNGTVAGSRAAIKYGWINKALQVGQTGKPVRDQRFTLQ